MGPRPLDITEALAEAARAMTQSSSLEEKLDAIVHTALGSMPGFDHVGTSITHRHGEIETKAATDQLVWQLDALQVRVW
ncbi:MAG TPA: hypothetical protein VFG63_09200 [Nocardioidaceae bacterium]|nr:hypothetical protein [Nocardioidaceae bacterium]